MSDLCFWSDDRRYGLAFSEKQVAYLLQLCETARGCETGGVLVGVYTHLHDCAVVSSVSKAPSDSRKGRFRFERGVQGLQRWLNELWRNQRHYYLGEWHFHPCGTPVPSVRDVAQMQHIATSPEYCCPEPILVIIGGSSATGFKLSATVFPRGMPSIELLEEQSYKPLAD